MFLLFVIYLSEIHFQEQPDIWLESHGTSHKRPHVAFFAPHENENVVNEYLSQKVSTHGGRFFILRQWGDRHVVLRVEGKRFEADPNRIFTPIGVKSTLLMLNPSLKEDSPLFAAVFSRTVNLGKFILGEMGSLDNEKAVIIAIHNNTDGFDNDGKGGLGTISMERYAMKLEAGAKYILRLHRGKGDEDDLYFINREEDFNLLKERGWNIVLQHPQVAVLPTEDDGSLSVYAEKIGARYLNIEAQRKEGDDHLEIQKKMVDAVFEIIK